MTLSILIIQIVAVIAGPPLVAWWLHHRFGTSWSSAGWGALTFPLSQLVRIPLLLGTAALINPIAAEWSEGTLFWTNFFVLSLTSGIFEEGARYIVLNWAAKGVRSWREGLMYGVGHGGVEAILLVGGTAITNLVLLLNGDSILAQLEQAAPDQIPALATQIEALQTMAWYLPLIAVWERGLAIILHISASLLVLLSVMRRDLRLLLLAMLYHAAYNAIALLAVRYVGALGTEVALTLATLVPIYLIWRLRDPLTPPEKLPGEEFIG